MSQLVDTVLQNVVDSGNELVKEGLVSRTWGNVSGRIDKNLFAVTPSGIAYDLLNSQNIVTVNIDSLEFKGNIKPSSEKGIHAAVYKNRSDINFVIHTHQLYASILASCLPSSKEPLNLLMTKEEQDVIGSNIFCASYALPGTKSLCKKTTIPIMLGANVILLKHHGALILGSSKEEAFKRSVCLEEIAKKNCTGLSVLLENGGTIPNINKVASQDNSMFDNSVINALRSSYPEFCVCKLYKNSVFDYVQKKALSNKQNAIKPMIDDFAQIAGTKLNIIYDNKKLIKAIKDKNCVIISNLGLLCCTKTEEDNEAVAQISFKNCLAWINSVNTKMGKSLSPIDSKIQRTVYITKYSKQNRSINNE